MTQTLPPPPNPTNHNPPRKSQLEPLGLISGVIVLIALLFFSPALLVVWVLLSIVGGTIWFLIAEGKQHPYTPPPTGPDN